MRPINVHEAKTHFSKLIDAAISGKEIIISKAGKPVAKLTAISNRRPIRLGILKGKIKIASDFDAPLPNNIISSFEGK